MKLDSFLTSALLTACDDMAERRAREEAPPVPKRRKNQAVVLVNGCYDVFHYGHANALRQARRLGDCLVAGVHSDEEITKNKGPPLMNQQERYKIIRAIKWVDEVIEDLPYTITPELLDKYNIDFVAHGDDMATNSDGIDIYELVKKAGRYKEYTRTQGVSTTDLVGRMLRRTRRGPGDEPLEDEVSAAAYHMCSSEAGVSSLKVMQFQDPAVQEPGPDDVVVYVPGGFDLFHSGHADFLEKCRELGNYVIVGLYNDQEVKQYMGMNCPIMNLQERALTMLSCKYVSQVVIGAPYSVTEGLLDGYKVDIVAHGNTSIHPAKDGSDPFAVPRRRGIFKTINSGNSLTTDIIMQRIINNRPVYVRRNSLKEEKELKAIELKDC